MKCPDCNGTGKIELLTSTKACAACGGKGEGPSGAPDPIYDPIEGGVCVDADTALRVQNAILQVADEVESHKLDRETICRDFGVTPEHIKVKRDSIDVTGRPAPHAHTIAVGSNEAVTILAEPKTLDALQELRKIFDLNELEVFRLNWMGLDGYFRKARDAAKTTPQKECISEGFMAVRDAYFVKHDELCRAERAKRECTFYGENDILPV